MRTCLSVDGLKSLPSTVASQLATAKEGKGLTGANKQHNTRQGRKYAETIELEDPGY